MPTPVSAPRISAPVFGSSPALKSARPQHDQSVRFGQGDTPGADAAPKKEASFLQGLWSHFKGPAKIGFIDRATAFFSPTHLKNGWKFAREIFQREKTDGNTAGEILGMALDVIVAIFTVGMILPLLALLPGLNFSRTFEAFATGVQRSKEMTLEEKKAAKAEANPPESD